MRNFPLLLVPSLRLVLSLNWFRTFSGFLLGVRLFLMMVMLVDVDGPELFWIYPLNRLLRQSSVLFMTL